MREDSGMRLRAMARVAVVLAASLCAASGAAAADLAVVEVAVGPASTVSGTPVRATIRNIGTGAAGTSRGRLYVSADVTLDAGDTLLATFEVPALAPGASAASLVLSTLPGSTGFVIAVADAEGTESESNEANNSRAVPRSAADPYDPPGVLRVCASCPSRLLSEAAARVLDGQTILVDPTPAPMTDCAVIPKSNVTIRGVLDQIGNRPVVGNLSCSGKGVIVFSNSALRNLTIEGLEIVGARVPDANGAAIRFQATDLTVRNLFIHDNENGILTSQGGTQGAGLIRIEHSVFARNGSPLRPGLQHNVYVSGAALTTLEFIGNVSLAGIHEGHELKTRAERSTVTCSVLAGLDSVDSYTIDFPQAGTVTVEDNVLQQGPQSSNKAMFSFGRESNPHPARQLRFSRNVVVDDKPGGYFFALGTGSELSLSGDTLIGGGALVAIGPAAVSDTSTRFADRAAYRTQTGVPLADWSPSTPVLPDLPAVCARVHPRRFSSFTQYLQEVAGGVPRPPVAVVAR